MTASEFAAPLFRLSRSSRSRGGGAAAAGRGAAGRAAGAAPGTLPPPAPAAGAARSVFADLTPREIGVLTPLIALILVLGFFPGPVLDVINPSVTATMHEVGLPDPVGGVTR